MKSFINNLRVAIAKRSAYCRTRDEIAYMPLHTALDLDIYPGDAEKIARRAVYGF